MGAVPLSALMPDGKPAGTSLILARSGLLLYAVRPTRREERRNIVEVTGIGGGLEAGDASPAAGVLREALEETGCQVQLDRCERTAVVWGPQQVRWLGLRGEAQPAAVVFRRYGTPPHQPWHEQHAGQICVVVFSGQIRGRPRPRGELAGLIWLTPRQVVAMAQQDVPLSWLLEWDAAVVERRGQRLPRSAWARLTDSQEALVLALGDGALGFYSDLAYIPG